VGTKGKLKLDDAENEFIRLKANKEDFQNCVYWPSYIIRNATAHSLIWDDNFVNKNSYSTLFNCLIDSIFWAAWKCWIE
jgi:hypothetical protein